MKNKTGKPSVLVLFLFLLQFNLPAKTVRGIVVDVNTNEPLKDVIVMVVDTSNAVRFMQMTDSTGLFLINGIKEDKFNVRTYRYGYINTTTGPYNLSSHDTLSMLIRLEADPIMLGEVVITATKTIPYLDRVHFYERKKMGMGHYVTWNDFKNRGLSSVYDIFRGIPGVVVNNNSVSSVRPSASLRGAASVLLIYVDGMLIPDGNIGWLSPESVQAVEVYNSISAPAEYSRGGLGGVILIWTKN